MSKLKTFHFEFDENGTLSFIYRHPPWRVHHLQTIFVHHGASNNEPSAFKGISTTIRSNFWKRQENNRVISGKTDFEWAPHSPDLSPPDFFLWGYLKDRVYKTNPQTIGELKRNIQTEMEAIDEATCRAVMSNFIRRMEMCQHQEGGHLEQLL